MSPPEAAVSHSEQEVARQMQICNACRYCESYCAVFQAMTRRTAFPIADAHYLANLCHNCGACLHACQYAPPHDFAVNVPRAMAEVRRETYTQYAWPAAFASLYRHNGLATALASAGAIALFLILAIAWTGPLWQIHTDGNFYAVFPHRTLVLSFGAVFAWSVLALTIGVARFWRGQAPGRISPAPLIEAAGHAVRLTYLDGGHGDGCNEESDRFTRARRIFHHFTFHGFLLCFAATSVATVYHYVLGWAAPYPVSSLPVLLGTAGGLGLVIGPTGLLWLNLRRHPRHGDPGQKPMDRAFIVLLLAISVTGLALLAWRESAAMALLLAVHLGCVMALFMTMPYGKFAHAVYRCAALLKWTIERRQPNRLRLGGE